MSTIDQQIATKCSDRGGRGRGEKGSTSLATRPATIWLRQRVSRTNAPRVKPGRLPKNIEEGRSERETVREKEGEKEAGKKEGKEAEQ